MWWVKKGGRQEGPFDEADLKRRIALGLFGRFDRVSQDRVKWVFVKDTSLWKPTEAPVRQGRATPIAVNSVGAFRRPNTTTSQPSSANLPSSADLPTGAIPERLRLPPDDPPVRFSGRARMMLAVAATVVVALGTVGVCALVWKPSVRSPEIRQLSAKNEGTAQSTVASTGHVARAESNGSSAVTNDIKFSDIKYKVVVIGNEGGSGGSAFLLKDQGKIWLVTNEHVTRDKRELFQHVMLLDGRELKLGRFEIAEDRDIARFEVIGDYPTLKMAETIPDVGDRLSIYGNSLGGGSITELKGKVKSIGPLRLEVDTDAVPGNSGSAVLNEKGDVTGIFTYATNKKVDEKDKSQWGVKGTQFDAVRRFAVRFTNVRWREMDWEEYLRLGGKAYDLVHFLYRLYPLLDVDVKGFDVKDYAFGLFYEKNTGRMFKIEGRFEELLVELSKACGVWLEADRQFTQLEDVEANHDEKMHLALESLKARKVLVEARLRTLEYVRRSVRNEKWTPQMKGEMVINAFGSIEDYNSLVEWYIDKQKRVLREIDKVLNSEEE